MDVETGDDVAIGGFIITGADATTPKKVIIRAIGPSLSSDKPPVAGALADPVLELHKPDGSVLTNDNWKGNTAVAQMTITDNGLAPKNDLEAVLVANLLPVDPAVAGTGEYTAIMRGNNNGVGVGLVEVYDIDDPTVSNELANISTRGFVGTGDNV